MNFGQQNLCLLESLFRIHSGDIGAYLRYKFRVSDKNRSANHNANFRILRVGPNHVNKAG